LTTILLVGVGAVGARAARQLVDTGGVERVLLADVDTERLALVARALGHRADAITYVPGSPLPDGVSAVASALPPGPDVAVAQRALATGVPYASSTDDSEAIAAVVSLDADARRAGVVAAPGCGLAPGLADVLARHAADALTRIDEVHIARSGVAGPASRATLRRARRDRPAEWRDGAWQRERRGGPELVWFPDPIGARECETVAAGTALTVAAFPELEQATTRVDEPPGRSLVAAMTRRVDEDGWGAVRVEIWGWRGQAREAIVYGVIERTAVAAGTVLALTAGRLAGVLTGLSLRAGHESGVQGLGALFDPPPFLAELARRGVKAAAFEGVAVA
jgi:hypothetical protein